MQCVSCVCSALEIHEGQGLAPGGLSCLSAMVFTFRQFAVARVEFYESRRTAFCEFLAQGRRPRLNDGLLELAFIWGRGSRDLQIQSGYFII